jgi:VWFA-related protein
MAVRSSLVRGGPAAALVIAAAVAALTARPQDPQPTFKTEANYIRVDVYPTLNGAPVADLRREDFEVYDENVLQTVDTFEHVTIRPAGPQEVRREPNTVAESREMLDNGRARVFLVFLDTGHVEVDAAHNIRQPLINALNRLIGPEDLVGVMTPDMSARDVTFARRTTTIEGMLTRHWDWGERGRRTTLDPQERSYQVCYPGYGPVPQGCQDDDRGVADEMIERRREKMTLDALDDLVQYLRTVREERKALLVVSDGWKLFRPNPALTRRLNCTVPTPTIGLDPRTGRMTNVTSDPQFSGDLARCEGDRMSLASIDDSSHFETLIQLANRSNVSFYPIDPRGLPVWDTSIDQMRTGKPPAGQTILPPPSVDGATLRARQTSLRDLAFATDGMAVVNASDLDAGMRRITDDLSSYYLLSYYSSGKLDGKFHSIRVRIKRPGVQVRARRGYLAASTAELTRGRAATAVGSPAAALETSALASAISSLGAVARAAPLRVMTAAAPSADARHALWTVVEVAAAEEWRSGGTIDLMLLGPDGQTAATAHGSVTAGMRSVRTRLDLGARAASEYTLRVRAVPAAGGSPSTDIVTVGGSQGAAPAGALLARRGPATAGREAPTADVQFRRNEQIRVDLPGGGDASVRLLDRAGKPMAIPLTVAAREDSDGSRWQSTMFALAPLAPGDYVVEWTRASAGAEKVLVAFRVVP